jgi:DNA-binding XRE family transcriptional regulator
MNSARKKRLEAAGWRVGTEVEFLGLTRPEVRIVKMKVALSQQIKSARIRRRLTQQQLAELLGSSQSRIAKLEMGGSGATLDLFFRALFALGVTNAAIAREIHPRKRPAA